MRRLLALGLCLAFAPSAAARPESRPIGLAGPYLKIPVAPGAAKVRLTLTVAGRVAFDADVELAAELGTRFVFADVTRYRGQTGQLTADPPAPGLALVATSDDDGRGDTLAATAARPAFHFAAHRGWLNDPNGLVHDGDKFHLFFQHNPYGTRWGNMHWGHAISTDLFNWAELPTALAPKRYGDWAFSGSALVDKQNRSGFGDGRTPPLVAAFTSTGRGECIAFSLDNGTTWAEFDGNPVVRHKGRDPKIFYHTPTSRFVMAVYDEGADGRAKDIAFYTSPNLKSWRYESRIGGFYECPDLFELRVRGRGDTRWVLLGADGAYRLGDFDGTKFVPAAGRFRLWHGHFYAAQTFANAPDGRTIQIGWARGIDTFDRPYSGQMTVPAELSLRQTPAGLRLFAEPARELLGRETPLDVPKRTAAELVAGLDAHDLTLVVRPDGEKPVALEVAGVPVSYDPAKRELKVGDDSATVPLVLDKLELRVLVDRLSVEVFAQDGLAAFVARRPAGAGRVTAGPGVRVTRLAAVR